MKLRDKDPFIQFQITDPKTSETWRPDPREHLTSRQIRKMGTRPDMILFFAHHLAEQARKDGHEDVEVRVKARASLNSRLPQLMIDPKVDLASQPRTLFARSPWILSLQEERVTTVSDGSSGFSFRPLTLCGTSPSLFTLVAPGPPFVLSQAHVAGPRRWVIECGGRFRFSPEPRLCFLVTKQVSCQEFQSYRTLEVRVLGLVNHTHPAPADFGEDLVVADRAADHDGQIVALPDTW